MLIHILAIWGCMPEITNGCIDMTNASSTYLSIAVGAVVGALISWLVFALQKKSSIKQEENLQRLNELNESHDRILKLIQQFQKHQEHILDQILSMDKKIDYAIEKKKDIKWCIIPTWITIKKMCYWKMQKGYADGEVGDSVA